MFVPLLVFILFLPLHSIQLRNWDMKAEHEKKKAFASDEGSKVSEYSLYKKIQVRMTPCLVFDDHFKWWKFQQETK